jgi:unsaturated rhamnogalacturonyl hydrolase
MRNLFMCLMVLITSGISVADGPASQPSAATQSSPEDLALGQGKVVGLDYFFNHQEKNGQQFHYIWDDVKSSGYSRFGDIWKQFGASIASLPTEPTRDDLNKYSIFIIVNPSTEKTAADHKPNYIQPEDADTIAAWVNDGGVLAMFANDKNNCEFDHYNLLANKFGINFNYDLRNTIPTIKDRVRGTFNDFPANEPLFAGVQMIFMKEICTLTLKDPAQPLLIADKQDGAVGKDIIMATAHYGKGFVFAVGDPWFYNEYIDLKNPPLTIENRKAAENFVRWMLGMASLPTTK